MMAGVSPDTPEYEPILSDAEQSIESHDGGAILHDVDGSVHIASKAEKKTLWWRSAVINSFFILTWYHGSPFYLH